MPYPVVALVGYTNAGKSTLFNRLTGASVFAEDLLFATLDPTMRRVTLENGQDVILSDTVGFIADLPTHLVAAFRATLEQVQHADVILHVRDAARPDSEAQKEDVIAILADLGIEYDTDPRIVEVLNKIDLLDEEAHGDILRRDRFTPNAVALSALTGEGTDSLLNHIEKLVSRHRQAVTFAIPPSDGQAAAWLYDHGHVLQRTDEPDYIYLTVTLEPANIGRFRDKFSYSPLAGEPDAEEQVHGRQHRS